MIEFKNLKIANFMSLGEVEMDLTKVGFTLISAENHRVEDSAGSNGSGKSSLMEALVWNLTGETIRGNKDVINRFTTGPCLVELTFNFKGYTWVIKRGISRSKEKSLTIFKNGQELPSKGYRDSEEVLQRELPELNFKFLNSVVVLGQGLPGRFTNNTPSGRKAVLEELTNADFMITQIKEAIKRRGLELSDNLRINQDAALKATSEKGVLEAVLKKLQEEEISLKSFNLDEAKKELEELVVKGKEASVQVDKLKEEESKFIADSKAAYEAYLAKENSKKDEISDLRSKLNVSLVEMDKEKSEECSKLNESHTNEVFAINARIDKLNEAVSHNNSIIEGGYCKYCGQKLSGFSEEQISEAKTKRDEALEELKKAKLEYDGLFEINRKEKLKINSKFEDKKIEAKQKIESQISEVEEKYRDELEKLKGASSDIMFLLTQVREKLDLANSSLVNLRGQYQEKNSQIRSYEDRLVEMANKISETLNSIKIAESNIITHTELIEKYQERLKINKQMDTFASRDFRGILLENIISRLDQILKHYSELVYGNQLTNFCLEGNAISISFDGKEYESLSGGEQQKLNLLLQLSLRDLIIELSGVSGSILAVDECFDGLDSLGCEKVIGLFQTLDTSVYIITHHADSLQIPFDQELVVVKGQDGVASLQIGV